MTHRHVGQKDDTAPVSVYHFRTGGTPAAPVYLMITLRPDHAAHLIEDLQVQLRTSDSPITIGFLGSLTKE